MPDWIPIDFDQPLWLVLLLMIIPVFLMAQRSIGGLSAGRAYTAFALRSIVVILLTIALAQPIFAKRGEGLTVMMVIDRSLSIPLQLKESSVEFLQRAAAEREKADDRIGVVTVARDASITAMPDTQSLVVVGDDSGDLEATNLEAGIQMALAIKPEDTAGRIVLVTDGNQTVGQVMDAAKTAKANGIPIDVVLLQYERRNEVIFDQLVAPATARVGQDIRLRMALRAQDPVTGTLRLQRNGEWEDLNGNETGDGLRITIEPGPPTVIPIGMTLNQPNAHQFKAFFEPDEGQAIGDNPRNNSAVAVTFVGGRGRVLVIEDGTAESAYLVEALEQSGIAVELRDPTNMGDLVALSSFDAVILANVNRRAFSVEDDRNLKQYVFDLGGGLIMLGGPDSFGAGGWIGSQVAEALPVNMDPPQTRNLPRGALALVMHSCEMPQGNFWGQQVANAAINALTSADWVGIVGYSWQAGVTWSLPMQPAGDKQAALAAAKKMANDDMPDMASSFKMAIKGLESVSAGKKHMIMITDGDPQFVGGNKILNDAVAAGITISTVEIGGHGTRADTAKLQNIANTTGGTFYPITNPKKLPQIFITEAQLVSRSLIQEGEEYQPQVLTRLPGPMEGFSGVPMIDGYVLSAPREGLAQTTLGITTDEGIDPIYAYWNHGIGKSIAYTSDITGRWGSRWLSWDQFKAFWEQSVRWVMRPGTPNNIDVRTRTEGDKAIVEMQAIGADDGFLNFLNTRAVVIQPDGKPIPLSMQQVGPGLYRGEFESDQAGAYLVNVTYDEGAEGQTIKRNVQAAVSVPFSQEFRAVHDNEALLRDLVQAANGRLLTPGDPELADFFDRTNLEVPKSNKYIWSMFTIIAACLFLLDVGVRRVAISPEEIRKRFRSAVGQRGEKSQDTVAAWKRAKSQVDQTQRRQRDAEAESADRTVKFDAETEGISTDFNVESDQPVDTGQSPAQVPRRQPKPEEKADDEGDYTSRLLRAKRRARGEEDSEGDANA